MVDGNLRIRIAAGPVEVELEGAAKIVIQQLELLKSKGLGKIFQKAMPSPTTSESTTSADASSSVFNSPSLDSAPLFSKDIYEDLNGVIKKELGRSEVEWLLLYAFYSSEFGKVNFTRNEIQLKYQDFPRDSSSFKSNLSNNLKTLTKRNWLKKVNHIHYIMTDEGKKIAKSILGRKKARPSILKEKKSKEGSLWQSRMRSKVVPSLAPIQIRHTQPRE